MKDEVPEMGSHTGNPQTALGKTITGAMVALALAFPAGAGDCVWKGDAGGNGAMSVPGNWEGGVAPVTGDAIVIPGGDAERTITNDLDESVELDSVRILDANRGKVTFAGEKTMTLTGATAWVCTNAIEVAFPLILKPTGTTITLFACCSAKAGEVAFRGAVTLIGDSKVFNTQIGNNRDGFCGGKVHYYGPVTTSKLSDIKNVCPSYGIATHLHDKVVTRTLCDTGYEQGYWCLHSTENDYDEISVAWGQWVIAQGANVFAAGAPLSFQKTGGVSANNGSYDLNGFDQTANRIISYADGAAGAIPPGNITSTKEATLTLRGTESARTVAAVNGKVSVVWNPTNDTYVQTFAKRASATTGSLTVKRGTVAIAEDATFLNLTGLVIEDGATLSIAEGTANPFGTDKVAFEVRGTGKIVVPDGMELKFRKITVSGVPQAANRSFTREAGWIEGEGTVVASETDLAAGKTYWAAPVSGVWTNETKWTTGVPDAETEAIISASDADYEVLFNTAATVGATTVGNAAGTATLLVTNAADGTAASLALADGKSLTIDAGGRLELGGTSAIAGTVSDANNSTIVSVNRGGTVRTTGGTVTVTLTANADRAINMQGGVAEFIDTKVVYKANINSETAEYIRRYFGSGTMRFDGEAELIYDSGADMRHTQYVYIQPNNNGEEARVEFCGNSARTLAPGGTANYYMIYVGGGKTGRSTLLFDTGTTKTMQDIGNQVNIGYCSGIGELIVRRGQVSAGAYTLGIGTPGSDKVNTELHLSTGIVEVCEGASLTYSGAAGRNLKEQASYSSSAASAPGLMVGHGIASQNLGAYYRGELRVLGGTLKNNYGSFFVGSGPRGDGEVIQTGGTFESQNVSGDTATTNEVAIGVFGGTGVFRMSGGDFKTRKNVYVGGATCDDLHREITNVVVFAHQFHDAKGRVSVSGGTFQTEQSIVLGRDGTGVLELSSTGVVKAAAIVVSNTVGQAASHVRFTSDAEGRFGSIDPATRLSFEDGSKIVIDATDFPADAKRQTLLALENDIAGFDYIKDHVELVNAPQGATADWSEDGRRLRFGCRKGLSIIVR